MPVYVRMLAWRIACLALLLTVGMAGSGPMPTRAAPVAQADQPFPPQELAALAQPPVRAPITDEVFYFVLPDRFANGNPANDLGGLPNDRRISGFDPTQKAFYHGGDLAGLTSQLDYLAGLGVTAIWLTPVFTNKAVQGSGDAISAAYHGYWITDFTAVDPHLGSAADLAALIDAAHARGVKVFFDIILNHTADVIQYAEGQFAYRSKADFPYRDAAGNIFDDKEYAGTGDFPALDPEQSFPYTPLVPPAEAVVKVPAWLNDPSYYHNRGDSQFSGESSLYGDFSGLDDLFTEQPAVVQGLIDIYNQWITDFAIDGFRIDTVKHANVELWRAFVPAILDHAQSVGRQDFTLFGEVFTNDANFLSYYTTDPDLPDVLDFRLQAQVRNYVSQQGRASDLATFFAFDDYFTDEDSNVYSLPGFVGNHDMGRFGYFLAADNGTNLDDAARLARSKLAYAMLFFGRGVPIIYYGDEQGFGGDGGDTDSRQDMFPSQVASYNDDDLIGTDATPAAGNFDTNHPLYQALATYAGLYQAHPALRRGAQIHRYAAQGAGLYAFSRFEREARLEYVVAFNNLDGDAQASVPTYQAEGVGFNLVYVEGGDAAATLTTAPDGTLALEVPAWGFVIYQAEAPLPPSTSAPAVTLAQPVAGQTVELGYLNLDGNQAARRMEVRAEIAGDDYAEVTFAVRAAGSDEFTSIGVDDNPPYRVFYDASGWPADTALDFVAVVNDLNQHYAAALAEDVTPVYAPTVPPSGQVAIVHYQRSDGNYGRPASPAAADFWGLHLWGGALAPGVETTWDAPMRFWGADDYGRFAWIDLADPTQDVNFIVHRGETKDGTSADRRFNPTTDGPEIWLRQDDPAFYTSQAAAQGFVTIHYRRPDQLYAGWGLHVWGDGLASGVETIWETPRPPDGINRGGAFWRVPVDDVTLPVNFVVHRGESKDPGPDQSFVPQAAAAVWVVSGEETLYPQACAAEGDAILHYHRPAGDYGNYRAADFSQFWGLHTWNAAADPGWATPRRPGTRDLFGIRFRVPLTDPSQPLGYIFHRGDTKDPGPDQFLDVGQWGCEVWQVQGANPAAPYVLPRRAPRLTPE